MAQGLMSLLILASNPITVFYSVSTIYASTQSLIIYHRYIFTNVILHKVLRNYIVVEKNNVGLLNPPKSKIKCIFKKHSLFTCVYRPQDQ